MGVSATYAARRAEWIEEWDAGPRGRVVPFPGSEEFDRSASEGPATAEEPVRPRRRRTRQARRADSLPRFVIAGGAMLVAVLAVVLLMVQLGQLGQRALPAGPPAPTAAGLATAAPTGPPRQTGAPAPEAPPGQGPLRVTSRVIEPSYAVAPGDTLGTIAATFGTTVEALQSINNLADRNALSVGQKLVIPNQP